jgi:NADPH-dependent 7-cyano-7-deazaguanine reductase QueF-like protein
VKNLPSDKVFFHFFQNILNARGNPLVARSSLFCRFIGFGIACLAKNSPFFITQSKWNAVSLSWIEKYFSP